MNPALPDKWYYVYLLTSQKVDQIYIGSTNNLETRLAQHEQGKCFSTKKILPIELIYFEGYRSKEMAYRREKSLKEYGTGLAKLKSRIGISKKGRAG